MTVSRPSICLRTISCITIAIALTGCAERRSPAASVPRVDYAAAGYVDLQPDWRVRAVTPVTKSGSFNVVAKGSPSRPGEVSLKASDDFLGYEISYYTVDPRRGGGVSIRFDSATITRNGKTRRAGRPLVHLFLVPADDRFVRLLFLTRVSPADHDQGIIAAPSMAQLQALTAKVQSDPERNCTAGPQAFCSWIPLGIAIQPERKARAKQWVPAT